MTLFLYINILLFEVLYYSSFMYYSKKEGNFLRYFLTFTIITLIGIIIDTNTVYSYLALITMIMIGLKYFVKVRVSLFDMLVAFIMILVKVLIELPIYIIIFNRLGIFVTGLIYSFFKILFICITKNKLNKMYLKMQKLWRNNNFYIRYIFTTIMLIYTIISCVFIIFYYL